MNDNEKDYVRTIIRDMERQYTCEASSCNRCWVPVAG
jgi:hypothetical protein